MSMLPEFGRRIITESYYEGRPDLTRVEIEDSILTTTDTLLSDMIKTLTIIKQHPTPKLSIVVHMDKYGQPQRIERKYVASQERNR